MVNRFNPDLVDEIYNFQLNIVISIVDLVSSSTIGLSDGGYSGEMRIRGDRTINISYLLRINVWCPLEFLNTYPHDEQVAIKCL